MNASEASPAVALVGTAADTLLDSLSQALPQPHAIWASLADLHTACMTACIRPRLVIIHNPSPGPDNVRLANDLRRGEGRRTGVLLVTSPLARYRQLEPWYALCDAVLNEATACEILGRYLDDPPPPGPWGPAAQLPAREWCAPPAPNPNETNTRRKVAVVSTDFETRVMLADVCQRAGYRARPVSSWREARGAALALWDVPVLTDWWPAALRVEARRRPVVTLCGFSDRALVRQMKAAGARACLDLPCATDDLAWVLDRLCAEKIPLRVPHGAHAVPGPPNHAPSSGAARALAEARGHF